MGVVFGYKVRWVDVGYPRRTTLAAREMSYGDLVTAADWPANSGINAQRCVWVLTVDASQASVMTSAVLAKAQSNGRFRALVNAAALRVLEAKAARGLLS